MSLPLTLKKIIFGLKVSYKDRYILRNIVDNNYENKVNCYNSELDNAQFKLQQGELTFPKQSS